MGFGSLEAALTTTADVALQIALAGGRRAGAGAAGIMADFLERLYKTKTKRQKCQ
jgi:predicted Zn-dependent peptidase